MWEILSFNFGELFGKIVCMVVNVLFFLFVDCLYFVWCWVICYVVIIVINMLIVVVFVFGIWLEEIFWKDFVFS